MRVEQTLHGYREGHHLLTSSVALTDEEGWTLEQLSDLSGQLELDEDFDHFHTAYPAGRWFVVARTWHDREADRRGTVLTHSLLLPREQAARELDDVGRLYGLFNEPGYDRTDLSAWERTLGLPELEQLPPLELSPQAALRLYTALLLVDIRPLLWLENASADAAGRRAWQVLPWWVRKDFAWCTRALHPRYLNDKPLPLMTPGPHSRSGFSSLRAVPVGTRIAPALEKKARELDLQLITPEELQAHWTELDVEVPANQLRLVLHRAKLHRRGDWAAVLSCLDIDETLGLVGGLARKDVELAMRHLSLRSPSQRQLSELAALMLRKPWQLAPSKAGALKSLAEETLASASGSAEDRRKVEAALRER